MKIIESTKELKSDSRNGPDRECHKLHKKSLFMSKSFNSHDCFQCYSNVA